MNETDPASSTKGKLLVATPMLVDPNFDRTVVLMLEHADEGAVGVVVNRPGGAALDEALPDWGALAARPAELFVGGPVANDALVCMARLAPGAHPEREDITIVLGNVAVIDLGLGPDAYSGVLDQIRVFSGYAGWGPGQLEAELAEGAWFVVDADPEDALAPEPEELWRFVLRRSGGKLALYANYPPSISVN